VDFDIDVKLAVYRHFARTGTGPTADDVAAVVASDRDAVLEAYGRLRALRVLVLEADGATIRMAPPFSGVPTQHRVEAGGVGYWANCAWDAFGVIAALGSAGTIHSRCEQSREPLRLDVGPEGPAPCDWLFHCEVPAAHWWDDITFT